LLNHWKNLFLGECGCIPLHRTKLLMYFQMLHEKTIVADNRASAGAKKTHARLSASSSAGDEEWRNMDEASTEN